MKYVCPMNMENVRAQMRKGVLELCILRVLGRGEAYASDLLSDLRNADMLVVEGTLYPPFDPDEKCGLAGLSMGGIQKWSSTQVLPPHGAGPCHSIGLESGVVGLYRCRCLFIALILF